MTRGLFFAACAISFTFQFGELALGQELSVATLPAVVVKTTLIDVPLDSYCQNKIAVVESFEQ